MTRFIIREIYRQMRYVLRRVRLDSFRGWREVWRWDGWIGMLIYAGTRPIKMAMVAYEEGRAGWYSAKHAIQQEWNKQ